MGSRHTFYEHEVELTTGEWVRRGMVWHFIPTNRAAMKSDSDYLSMGLIEIMAENFARNPRAELPDLGFTCHCGCLLTDADESCPNCIAWAIRDAIKWSWSTARTYTHTSHRERSAA